MLFMECGSIFKNDQSLTIQERARIAVRYEVRNFIVLVQRRWGACKGRHETPRPETIASGRAKLMTTGSVNDKRRSERLSTSRSAEKVERMLEMFMRSMQKSMHQAGCESRLTRQTTLSMFHKKSNYHP